MKFLRVMSVLSIGALFFAGFAVGQEESKPAKKKSAKDEAKETKGGRLPQYWGQIGLSEDQASEIRAVSAKYQDDIAAAKKKIADMEKKRDSEMEALLTPAQKSKLQELKDQAKAKKGADDDAKAKKPAKKKTEKKDTEKSDDDADAKKPAKKPEPKEDAGDDKAKKPSKKKTDDAKEKEEPKTKPKKAA